MLVCVGFVGGLLGGEVSRKSPLISMRTYSFFSYTPTVGQQSSSDLMALGFRQLSSEGNTERAAEYWIRKNRAGVKEEKGKEQILIFYFLCVRRGKLRLRRAKQFGKGVANRQRVD